MWILNDPYRVGTAYPTTWYRVDTAHRTSLINKELLMKLVTAIIQPDILDEVREALIKAEITRITVSRCTGRGRAGETELYRGRQVAPDLISKVRIDIACNDQFADTAVKAILSSAKHGPEGLIGDGKIFVTSLEKCIRIRTGEAGGNAI